MEMFLEITVMIKQSYLNHFKLHLEIKRGDLTDVQLCPYAFLKACY